MTKINYQYWYRLLVLLLLLHLLLILVLLHLLLLLLLLLLLPAAAALHSSHDDFPVLTERFMEKPKDLVFYRRPNFLSGSFQKSGTPKMDPINQSRALMTRTPKLDPSLFMEASISHSPLWSSWHPSMRLREPQSRQYLSAQYLAEACHELLSYPLLYHPLPKIKVQIGLN